MKVYISGQITGLDIDDARAKFENAENIVRGMGLRPVNPLTGSDQTKKWKEHMVRDIEMLFGCDAIFMIRNWKKSKGARIERFIAEEMGMLILHENGVNGDPIKKLKDAIYQATGISYEEYTQRNKKLPNHFARLVFGNYLLSVEQYKPREVARMVNRSRSTVSRYPENFQTEIDVNREFRDLVKGIEFYFEGNVSL